MSSIRKMKITKKPSKNVEKVGGSCGGGDAMQNGSKEAFGAAGNQARPTNPTKSTRQKHFEKALGTYSTKR